MDYLGYATIIANCIFMYWLRDDLGAVVIERLDRLSLILPKQIHESIELLSDV